MWEELERSRLLLGDEKIEKLKNLKVAVFGVGGVGGYVVEALARTGIGNFVITDNDKISISNINRQIIALQNTVGMMKTEVIKKRILDINPDADVEIHNCFYLPGSHDNYNFADYDYVIDCIDTVSAKIDIILQSQAVNTPVISSMGTGNKLNPAMLEVEDIYKTSVCPLARVMRTELKKRGVKKLKVVYSKETPIKVSAPLEHTSRRSIPGSVAFVPACAGLIIASEVIRELCEKI